jgi:hypothetical protein
MMRWFSHARIVQMSDFCIKFFKAAGAGSYAPKYLEGAFSEIEPVRLPIHRGFIAACFDGGAAGTY